MASWRSLGKVEALKQKPVQEVTVDGKILALTYHEGAFGAVSGTCLHIGGPLGQGKINPEGYLVCPWHQWMFHCKTGQARPGIPAQVASYELKIENGELLINTVSLTQDKHAEHKPHPLSRKAVRTPGPIRVLGISTTAMNKEFPRVSTSDAVLEEALAHAKKSAAETRLIKLNDLKFRACEGYYSKSAEACTWPCSITQMDPADELDRVYEALVFWADVVLISTPIRWGAASSLYFKMVERMNCIQNQETIANNTLIQNKVAAFLITGGQDNIQAVAGQMMTFFTEIGFVFPPHSFVAHSRGWAAEDMESNVAAVLESDDLKKDVRELVERCIETAGPLVEKSDKAAKQGDRTMDHKQSGPFVKDETPGRKAWCSCGASANQPYCDGSHKTQNTGKSPVIVEITEAKKVAWCGCKQSGSGPFCDGSHKKI
jgi:multimeric flavodoxin WrbA/nitrite reductase/ring-hydroxylating ferredoxin subunit